MAHNWLGRGTDFNPSDLAKNESMKQASALESSKTACEQGAPEVEKETVMVG